MMKTTIERLADDKLRLDVEVPEHILQDAVDQALVQMGREINLPGFRPGKVPPQAVLARLGRDAAVAEAVRYFLDDWYRAAVVSSGIRPVNTPEIDIPEGAGDGTFQFSATVEVAPKPKLPDLTTLEVDCPNLPDTQKYVDQVLEATLRGAGTLVDTGKPAAEGDEVVVDFRCTVDDDEMRGASAVGYQARIGDGRLLDELETAIIGVSAATDLDVPVDFPEDHPMEQLAGKHAHFHLKLREVQRTELPELSDDVAKKVSEFDTAEALVADIRGSIVDRLQTEVNGIYRANAVSKLAEVADFVEPQVLVERRQQELFMGLKQQLDQHGLSIEAYVDRTGQDMEALFAELAQSARDDLRRELSLLALAEEQDISISEEDLRAEIRQHADHSEEDSEAAMQQVFASGRADMLRGELLIQRTIDYLVEQVKPVAVDLPTAPTEAEQEAADAAGDEVAEGGQTPDTA